MNSTSQLEFHPDAESLSAFAEKALPVREREQMVAHLAGCSRCRQVIFLAQQAASDMEMAAAPAGRSAGRSGSWLSGWRLAWIPAAALAGVVGLVFLVHGRHGETGTETARAVTPVAPQNQAIDANSAVNNRVVVVKQPAPISHVTENQPEINIQSFQTGAAYEPPPGEIAPPRAARNETATVTAAPPPLQSESASAGQVIQAEPPAPDQINAMPLNGRNWVHIGQLTAEKNDSAASSAPQPPTSGMPQHVTGMNSGSAKADSAAKAKMNDMAERSQASRKAEARYAGSDGASTSQLKEEALPGSGYDAGARMPMIQFEAARETSAAPAPLPSGLAIISSVTARNSTLAIDQAGALFLSNDSGRHWESVFRQWAGRAVDVSIVTSLNGSSAAAAPTGGTGVAPALSGPVFELRNNKNQRWVSVDGMIWTAQ
jgi:hypothetical protein